MKMFCVKEPEDPLSDPFDSINCDPFADNDSEKSFTDVQYEQPTLNIKVYQIDAFDHKQNYIVCGNLNNAAVDSLKLKKNGEIAKKRGPKKGSKRIYKDPNAEVAVTAPLKRGPKPGLKRKRKDFVAQRSIDELRQCQASNGSPDDMKIINKKALKLTKKYLDRCNPAERDVVVKLLKSDDSIIVSPHGTEFWQIKVDPNDYFPNEPFKMPRHIRKHPKWNEFPWQCEFCAKGYKTVSTLICHTAEVHGACSRKAFTPCPCCPTMVLRTKYRRHLNNHTSSQGKLYCQYCIPDASEEDADKTVIQRFPYKKFKEMWYSTEESLRLHRKRKHPYAALMHRGWECVWMDND